MDITFLVGNGFDISAGLDTSYRSFYNWYYSQPSRTGDIRDFKEDIKQDVENGGKNWADFETGLGKYTSQFSTADVDAFFECYEDAVESIIAYLEREKNKFDLANIQEADVARLADGILNFYQELNPGECYTLEKIFISDRMCNTTINFISCNYTDILDRCIEKIASIPLKEWEYKGTRRCIEINPQVLHIHGTSNEYPILGVSEEWQIANRELLTVPHFANIMIKPQSVASIEQLWYAQADKTIEKSQIVCIWGMSLGSSDSTWWTKIMDWLQADKERHLILFWHTKTPPNRRSVLQYNQQIDIVKDYMFDYSCLTSSGADEIRKQIHVVFNTDKVLRISLSQASEKELVLT